jgi:5-methylcytosine-specific restriction endonuclease McrA
MRVLLLDQTLFPVKVITWQRAMSYWLSEKAEVLEYYETISIRSVNQSWPLPMVIKLNARFRAHKKVPLTRQNIFTRDHFSCQYCTERRGLTLDHVIPRSRGGPTSWTNLVTCCLKCNHQKGHRDPHEVGLILQAHPIEPRWSPKYALRMKKDDPEGWRKWFHIDAEMTAS